VSLCVKNLSFSYLPLFKDKIPFSIKNISFSVEEPSLVAIMGPNGSGKSTLLKIILGMNTPYEGEVLINSKNLASLSCRELAKEIAFVPQDTDININLNVIDIVTMGRYPYQSTFSFESKKDIELSVEALDMVGMKDFLYNPYRLLSGGEKQKVLIARALSQQAKLLFLDEPTAFLDVSSQLLLYDLLKKLKKDKKVSSFIITHNLHLAAAYCDQSILFKKGELFNIGPSDKVLVKDTLEALFDVKFNTALNRALLPFL